MLGVGLCGGVRLEADGRPLPESLLAGRQGRLVLAYLVCERHRSVPREELAELVWGEQPPSSWVSSLTAVVSKLRRALAEAGLDGAAALASAFGSYRLHLPSDASIDWENVAAAVDEADQHLRAGDAAASEAAARRAAEIARRGFLTDDCPWVDAQRARLHDLHIRAVHTQAEAHRMAGERARAVLAAREALALDELREASYRLLMQALADAGERGEALRVWERCRTLIGEELGADPAPETEAVYLAILGETTPATTAPLPSGVVTFLLTDIVESSTLWERNPEAMTAALQRHDQLVGEVAAAHGGVLLKAKLEGDATVSVFPRTSAGVAAAAALRQAMATEPWPAGAAPQLRMALHAGEAVERDGDYFGPALNRAARLRGIAVAGQILVSQAVAEVVHDHLPAGMAVRSLGERALRGMSRAEHVYELAPAGEAHDPPAAAALTRPRLASVLATPGPFVGRGHELDRLAAEWATATAGTTRGVLIAGEPGVGKTRLAAEWARHIYEDNAVVLYGRCDEELGAPYQPFAEALRALGPAIGAARLRAVRGVEELVRLVPELGDVVPGLGGPTQADPDTERALLFDALVRLFAAVSSEAPVVLVLDDLHWAAKPTLLLLRHLLRAGEGTRALIVGTYRSTDLDRAHPLAGVLADLHRDGTVERISLGGLATDDVRAYLTEAGFDDARLGAALADVTSGNPFFLIEVLRHLEETGGRWDPNTLPQGVREAVSRRLSRLSDAANEALLVGAVIGSRFSLDLAERVLERDLLDAIDEARQAELVVEEPGNRFRFNHALVRQSLLGEVASVRRTRLHQRVALALEAEPAGSDSHLADLARHWFECTLAGGAAKAVDYSRRAAEQAMARLAYEEAAELYDQALQAAEGEDSGCDAAGQGDLLLAWCEALLAAGDPAAAAGVIERLRRAAGSSRSLAAWATCYAAQLDVLTHPEHLPDSAASAADAAAKFAELGDADGEAAAHTVRAACLARLGRIADCEAALDRALTAGRSARNARRVNAVLGYAPLAALWGPSPIARASGRCLDVVRVLRITTGSPAVEAVALRCQALLEALRGRTDAARRMLGSARKALESLGHTHGLLEADLFAGMIELVAGQPDAAETLLRRAYDGFVARGVGVDAAQAAAHLARAVLTQGRADEAITLTEASERLAGGDLQAAIAWRAARAEALALHGHLEGALDAARAAVSLADATDALIDQADAHLSLSIVLRAAGRSTDAAREATRAGELYERKGASALVEATRQAAVAAPAPLPSDAPSDTRQDATTSSAAMPTRRVVPNLAFDALLNGVIDDAFIHRYADLMRADYVNVDHMLHFTYDREGLLDTFRLVPGSVIGSTPLATLGNHHVLARVLWESATGAEISLLSLNSVDDDGRIARVERFADDDLNPALARLMEAYAEETGDRAQLPRAAQSRALTPEWAEDAVLVDHRPAGLGTIEGREHIRAAARALGDVAGPLQYRGVDILGLTDRVTLIDYRTEGHTEAGEPFELPILWLIVHGDDGLQRRTDWYAPEQIEDALAAFDALTAPPPSVVRRLRPNVATANVPSGDIDEVIHRYGELMRDDYVCIDHPVQATYDGAALLETLRLGRDRGRAALDITPLVALGRRHMLVRVIWRSLSGAEVGSLNVTRVDDNGRYVRTERFHDADLNLALARLIEMHAEDELPPDRQAGRAHIARAHREQKNHCADDSVVVDHRPASLGVLTGREAIRAASGALHELGGGEVRWRFTDVRGFTERVTLMAALTLGVAENGGRFEIPVVSLNVFRDDGFFDRVEWYTPEQMDEALARFDELVAPPASDVLHNAAFRNVVRRAELLAARDWDGVAATFAPDVITEDRRLSARAVNRGHEDAVRYWLSLADVGVDRIESEPLATRGDRLILFRNRFIANDTYIDVLEVGLVDHDGLLVDVVALEPEALDAGFAELDARYLAGDGAPYAEVLRPMFDGMAASNRQEWSQVRATYADDLRVTDHRGAPYGPAQFGPEDLIAILRGGWEVSVRFVGRVIAVLEVTPTSATVRIRSESETKAGALTENDQDVRYTVRNGLIATMDFFEPGTVVQRPRPAGPPTHLENAASRIWDSRREMFADRAWDAYASATAEDAVLDDRRRIVGGLRATGPDGVLAAARSMASIGVTTLHSSVLAVRGQRLLLADTLASGAHGEGEFLTVFQIDEVGSSLASVLFDPDDLDAAYAELDARYLADEAAAHADVLKPVLEGVAAYNRQDYERQRALLPDDLEVIDHRVASLLYGDVGPDDMIDVFRSGWALSASRVVRIIEIPSLTAGGAVVRAVTTAETNEGVLTELELVMRYTVRSGRIRKLEFFEPDAVVEAEDSAIPPFLRNTAVDAWDETLAHLARRDWDGYIARMAPDAVEEDRRRIVGGLDARGPEEILRQAQSSAAAGVTHVIATPLAVRGTRLALIRALAVGRHAETELLMVIEVDHRGRHLMSVVLDADALDAAYAELDARYLAGEGAPHADTFRQMIQNIATYNRQDWAGYRALFADDLTVVDHRPPPAVYSNVHGADALVAATRSGWDLSTTRVTRLVAVPALTDDGAVVQTLTTAETSAGALVEVAFQVRYTIRDGLITKLEFFDPDAEVEAPSRAATPAYLENAATRGWAERLQLLLAKDWEAYAARMAPDEILEDRRSVVGGIREEGDNAALRFAASENGLTGGRYTTIAVRGDRLTLLRLVVWSESAEWELLLVFGVDHTGRGALTVVFDAGSIDAAYAELDARFVESLSTAAAAVWRDVLRRAEAYNSRDPEALRRGLASSFVFVDHRPVRWGTLDVDGWMKHVTAVVDFTGDAAVRVLTPLRVTGDGAVSVLRSQGTDAAGVAFQFDVICVQIGGGSGPCTRMEWYELEHVDEALARFAELTHPPTDAHPVTNEAFERVQALVALVDTRDWDRFTEAVSPGVVGEDRRAIIGGQRYEGRDGVLAGWKSIVAAGVTRTDLTPLATRGDRLVLSRVVMRGSAGEVEALVINGIDPDGLLDLGVTFDDLDSAFADLDARYLAGEGARFGAAVAPMLGLAPAYNNQDWGRVRAFLADELTVMDRRPAPALYGDIGGPEDLIAAFQSGWALSVSRVFRVLAVPDATPNGGVVRGRTTAETIDGAQTELEYQLRFTVRDGRITTLEFFEPDVAVDALPTTSAAAEALRNQAFRRWEERCRLLVSRDWDGLTRCLTADTVDDDRRSVVGGLRDEGVAAILRNSRAMAGVGVTEFVNTPIAVRGERAALFQTVVRGSRAEVVELCVHRIDGTGRSLGVVAFDFDDHDAAYEELDATDMPGETGRWWELGRAYARAHNARDWEALRDLHTDDFVCVDQRSLGFGTQTREEYLRLRRTTVELAPDTRVRVAAVIASTRNAALYLTRLTGSTDAGEPYEIESLSLGVFRGRRYSRIEFFAVDDVEAARARMAELDPPSPTPDLLHNQAFGWLQTHLTAFLDRDWDRFATSVSPAATGEDRRAVVGGLRYDGREAVVVAWRSIAAAGVTRAQVTPIATRGDHLILSRMVLGGSIGEVEALFIHEMTPEGLILLGMSFDPSDIDAAYAELDERYLASLPGAAGPTWRAVVGAIAGYNARSWDWFVPTDDFVFVDHRPVGWGTLDAPGWVAHMRALLEYAPDATVRVTAPLRLTGAGAVSLLRTSGTDHNGASVEFDFISVHVGGGSQPYRGSEWYPPEQIEEALARFDELTATPAARNLLHNAAFAHVDAMMEAFEARNWEAFEALIDPADTLDDRRALVGGLYLEGGEAAMRSWRSTAAAGATRVTWRPMATRGDHLLLLRALFHGSMGEVEALVVHESTPEGRQKAGVVFDVDDDAAAYDELDARYAVALSPELADRWATVTAAMAVYNRRDWPALSALITDDCVFADYRPAGWGELDAAGLALYLQPLVDLSPDHKGRIAAVLRLTPAGAVYVGTTCGTDPDGGTFAMDHIAVNVFGRDNRIRRSERFPVEDVEGALARFDDLAGDDERGYLDNQAARSQRLVSELILADDWSGLAALTDVNAVGEDRRPMLSHRVEGRDGIVAESQSIRQVGVTAIEVTPLAVRGERLVLTRQLVAGSSAETPILSVSELSAAGTWLGWCIFEDGDLDAAYDELDARYAGGEGSAHIGTWALATATIAAVNRRDWPAFRACVADECTMIDHRALGLPAVDVVGLIDLHRELIELAPNSELRIVAVVGVTDRGIAIVEQFAGTHHSGGGSYEMSGLFVCRLRNGKWISMEAFPVEETDIALAVLAAFDDPPDGEVAVPPTADATAATTPLGETPAAPTDQVLATRGDLVALLAGPGGRYRVVDAVGSEEEFDNSHAAFAALDARYLALLPADRAAAWRPSLDFAAAYNARDDQALEAAMTTDCVIVDDRITGWGTLDAKGLLRNLEQLITLAPDVYLTCVAVHHLSPAGSVSRLRVTGTVSGGGEFELVFESVAVIRDAKFARLELLPDGHVDEGVRRLLANS